MRIRPFASREALHNMIEALQSRGFPEVSAQLDGHEFIIKEAGFRGHRGMVRMHHRMVFIDNLSTGALRAPRYGGTSDASMDLGIAGGTCPTRPRLRRDKKVGDTLRFDDVLD